MIRLRKQMLSVVLSLCMVVGLFPAGAVTAFAAGNTTAGLAQDGSGGYYIHMPTSGTSNVTLDGTVTSFQVYDDGGSSGNYSNKCDGYLVLTAPEGYRLQVAGTIQTESAQYDWLIIYDGATDTVLGNEKYGSRTTETIEPLSTSGNVLKLYFRSDGGGNYAGFDLTVTLLDLSVPHGITVTTAEKGSVAADADTASMGRTVTLTVNPEEGYALSGMTAATTDGESVPVQKSGSVYSFVMPYADVTVTPVFKEAQMTWRSLQAELDQGGKVTLTSDVTAGEDDQALRVSKKDTTLDLNGYTIDRHLTEPTAQGYVLLVINDFTLVDTSENGTGKITGGRNSTTSSGTDSGGGVCVRSTFQMYGGNITGNQTAGNGGGVLVAGNSSLHYTFHMYGGSISQNTAKEGGGVYADCSIFHLYDGTISENKANNGGGVFNRYGYGGNGVTMSGGSIVRNASVGVGGGIYTSGPVVMTGGSVTGNSTSRGSRNNGGGVYVDGGESTASFQVSGSPVVTGNTCGEVSSNVLLGTKKSDGSYKRISVTGALDDEASIGVTTEVLPTEDVPAVNVTGDLSKYGGKAEGFFSDDPEYAIGVIDKVAKLFVPRSISVTASEGGSVAASTSVTAAGDTVTLTVLPDAHYELDTLTVKQSEREVQLENNQFTMPAGDVTVTATWQRNSYTITFDTDGGSEVAPITQEYNTGITEPTIPTREGYVFDGWEPALPDTMPGENLTVRAKWKEKMVVATIEDDLYYSLTDALNAANAGDVIQLQRDMEEPETVWNDNTDYQTKGAVLDLNDQTVTLGGMSTNGDVTVKNGTMTSRIVNDNTNGDSSLTLDHATLNCVAKEDDSAIQWLANNIVVTNGSTLCITGDTFLGGGEGKLKLVIDDPMSTVVLNNATISGYDPTAARDQFAQYLPEGYSFSEDGHVVDSSGAVVTEPVALKLYIRPAFKVYNLILSGQIGVNFYLDLPELEGVDYSNSYMEFTVNGQTTRDDLDVNDRNSTGEYYGFTCYVSSIQMAEDITAVFHYTENGEEKTIEKTYSVARYLSFFDGHESEFDKKTLDLIHAIADYGHFAQPFLAASNGWTVGEKYAEMENHYTFSYDWNDIQKNTASFAFAKNVEGAEIEAVSYSLDLNSETTVSVFLKTLNGAELSAATTFHDKTYQAVKQSDGRYRIQITGIPAHLLGEAIEISGTAGSAFSIRVSPLSYAHAILSSDADKDAKNAMAAFYHYYMATTAYRER